MLTFDDNYKWGDYPAEAAHSAMGAQCSISATLSLRDQPEGDEPGALWSPVQLRESGQEIHKPQILSQAPDFFAKKIVSIAAGKFRRSFNEVDFCLALSFPSASSRSSV